jgi:hypothetical protein
MRQLSPHFMHDLTAGFLSGITRQTIADPDLDLEIRNNYLNLYYKGNSLLKLSETRLHDYRIEIHAKFVAGLNLPVRLLDQASAMRLLENIPQLKQNVIQHGKHSLEIEYEQLLIRANNFENRNNSDYFVIDRQCVIGKERLDLIGFYWDRRRRRAGQGVPLCLLEVKFALNPDIAEVHQQLQRYHAVIQPRLSSLAEEYETTLRQKLELGLYVQSPDRLRAMQTLTFTRDMSQFQFVLILVDYNPNSSRLNLPKLQQLPFAKQIRVFHGGFAMWQHNVRSLDTYDV